MIKIESKELCKRVGSTKAAKIIGLSIAQLCIMRKEGNGPAFYKIGGRYYYDRDDIDAWIELHRVEPEAA